MDQELFEEAEAKFIAREIILSRLKIQGVHLDQTLFHTSQLQKTLEHIEALESTWSYSPLDETQTYGRKVKGEPLRLWSLPNMSARVLSYLVLYTSSRTILEIGTSVGYSTLHIAEAAERTGSHVYTLENFSLKCDLARRHFEQAGLEKTITLLEGDAHTTLDTWSLPLDFVFLDADKEHYGAYFDLLLPHLHVGSLLVADNINDYGHLMVDFLQKVCGSHFPGSRVYSGLRSTYVAQLDNGLLITKVGEQDES